MAWQTGEAEAILKVLNLTVSSFNLSQINRCMAELESISPTAQGWVQALLVDYAAALDLASNLNLAGTGKTLVKADVLEWEVDQGGGYAFSPVTEMQRIADEMLRYFGPCMGIEPAGGNYGTTPLIRS